MASRLKQKGRREQGQFVGIPKECMINSNYYEMSMPAKILLHEFCFQYNGYNNGDLCAAFSGMKKRGWRSKGTLDKAIKELKARGWIQVSRQGGRNQCSLYALTFQSVDDCKGKLDISPTNVASGDWKKLISVPPMSTNVPPMCTSSMD